MSTTIHTVGKIQKVSILQQLGNTVTMAP